MHSVQPLFVAGQALAGTAAGEEDGGSEQRELEGLRLCLVRLLQLSNGKMWLERAMRSVSFQCQL